jgi:hypothetical protein
MATRGWYSRKTHPKRKCVICCNEYEPRGPTSMVCSLECKKKRVKKEDWNATERQYAKISGNWRRYFSRLLNKAERDCLSVDDLIDLLNRQDGKCSLTGAVLTCVLEKGIVTKTNASIDRIDAGGPYKVENIQLVCSAVNRLRTNMTVTEYVDWCRMVVEKADKGS